LADNNADRAAKGRTWRGASGNFPKGEHHHSAKLTEEQVREIRQRYVFRVVGSDQLARQYGITPGNVRQIVTRRIWKDVP
jgi:hypothetical protein